MNIRAVGLVSALLLGAPLLARESTDVIVMKNGDRMTCEIKGLESGVLYVSPSYILGTISVDWSQVARIESHQLFLVKTRDGYVYTGTLNSEEVQGGNPTRIRVAKSPGESVVLERSQFSQVAETSGSFYKRFSGNISSGLIYAKANQSIQYNLSGLVAYPRERWQAEVGVSSNLSSNTGVTVSTRNQLSAQALHLLPWNNYFYGGLGNYLQSTEQGINRQLVFGLGVGRFLKNTGRTTISVLGGAAWENTHYRPEVAPIGTQNVAAALLAANVKLYRFNKTNLNLSAALLPALSQPGRVYFSTNASYYIKLFSNLSWNISFYGNWDNRPPGNLPGSDYGTSSGLTWTFGSNLLTSFKTAR